MRKNILCRKYFPVYVTYLEIISFRFISSSLGSIRFKARVLDFQYSILRPIHLGFLLMTI